MKKRRGPSIAEVVTAALERMERQRRRVDRDTTAVLHSLADQFARLANPPMFYGDGAIDQMVEGGLVQGKPARFVQMFTMSRGAYYSVLMGLDASGQLWERHQTVDKANKVVTEEWWEKMPMERRP